MHPVQQLLEKETIKRPKLNTKIEPTRNTLSNKHSSIKQEKNTLGSLVKSPIDTPTAIYTGIATVVSDV